MRCEQSVAQELSMTNFAMSHPGIAHDQLESAVLLISLGASHDGLGQPLARTPPAARRWKLIR